MAYVCTVAGSVLLTPTYLFPIVDGKGLDKGQDRIKKKEKGKFAGRGKLLEGEGSCLPGRKGMGISFWRTSLLLYSDAMHAVSIHGDLWRPEDCSDDGVHYHLLFMGMHLLSSI